MKPLGLFFLLWLKPCLGCEQLALLYYETSSKLPEMFQAKNSNNAQKALYLKKFLTDKKVTPSDFIQALTLFPIAPDTDPSLKHELTLLKLPFVQKTVEQGNLGVPLFKEVASRASGSLNSPSYPNRLQIEVDGIHDMQSVIADQVLKAWALNPDSPYHTEALKEILKNAKKLHLNRIETPDIEVQLSRPYAETLLGYLNPKVFPKNRRNLTLTAEIEGVLTLWDISEEIQPGQFLRPPVEQPVE